MCFRGNLRRNRWLQANILSSTGQISHFDNVYHIEVTSLLPRHLSRQNIQRVHLHIVKTENVARIEQILLHKMVRNIE